MSKDTCVLFRRGKNGISFYAATVDTLSDTENATIHIYFGIVGGIVQRSHTNVFPVNQGRANYKNALVVASERIAAIEVETLDKGYQRLSELIPEDNLYDRVEYSVIEFLNRNNSNFKHTLADGMSVLFHVAGNLKTQRTDTEDNPKAMTFLKAKLLPHHASGTQSKRVRAFPTWGTFDVQPKYDGVFCLVTPDGLRTRSGKDRHTPKGDTLDNVCYEIANAVKELYLTFPGLPILNGELYADMPLQQTISATKKRSDLTQKVRLCLFDVVTETNWQARREILLTLAACLDGNSGPIEVIPITISPNQVVFDMLYDNFVVRNSGEGLIIRKHTGMYTPGIRSKDVLKYINYDDAECTIVSVMPMPNEPAEAMLTVIYEGGDKFVEFNLTLSEFTSEERMIILQNKQEYIGLTANIRHRGFTESGIPRQAVCKSIE